MTEKAKQRRQIYERTTGQGVNFDGILEAGFTKKDIADTLLKIEAHAQKWLGGPARYTGNTRVYRSGAIGFEIRCGNCNLPFWVTGLPHAYCVDCREEHEPIYLETGNDLY